MNKIKSHKIYNIDIFYRQKPNYKRKIKKYQSKDGDILRYEINFWRISISFGYLWVYEEGPPNHPNCRCIN
jgi:hypothetical protein